MHPAHFPNASLQSGPPLRSGYSMTGRRWLSPACTDFFFRGNQRDELVLNSVPLVTVDREVNGRLTLYTTKNLHSCALDIRCDGQ